MLIIIIAGVVGGMYLDKWIAWKFPVFTVILTVLSVVLSIYIVIKDILKQ
ncbi:MAG: AtpZ/AtpI family protein [Bacteroidia bacterium]|nr:AtpZ/AtpI family protein [Bacteroidia bacterium]